MEQLLLPLQKKIANCRKGLVTAGDCGILDAVIAG
jgi:hypothetical protein